MYSQDIGPGNCLIDNWIRNNSSKKFDQNGTLARKGMINEIIFKIPKYTLIVFYS